MESVASREAQVRPEIYEQIRFKVEEYSVAKERKQGDNEDASFVDAQFGAVGVFDGVGGNIGSGRAAEIAAQVVHGLMAVEAPAMKPALAEKAVSSSLQYAHQAIQMEKQENPMLDRANISTTAVVVRMFEDPGGRSYIAGAHAGDSRAYLYSGGILTGLTLDHVPGFSDQTLLARKERQEKLSSAVDDSTLDIEEIRAFKSRSIIANSVGDRWGDPVVETFSAYINPGDVILLVSDGVSDNLTDHQIEAVVKNSMEHQIRVVDTLVNTAYHTSKLKVDNPAEDQEIYMRAKRDDITAALIRF